LFSFSLLYGYIIIDMIRIIDIS